MASLHRFGLSIPPGGSNRLKHGLGTSAVDISAGSPRPAQEDEDRAELDHLADTLLKSLLPCAWLRRFGSQAASCSGLPILVDRGHSRLGGTKSRESIYGSSIRASAERAKEARKEADRLGCVAWNQCMLGYRGPANRLRRWDTP
jgi:hypothetical protein